MKPGIPGATHRTTADTLELTFPQVRIVSYRNPRFMLEDHGPNRFEGLSVGNQSRAGKIAPGQPAAREMLDAQSGVFGQGVPGIGWTTVDENLAIRLKIFWLGIFWLEILWFEVRSTEIIWLHGIHLEPQAVTVQV